MARESQQKINEYIRALSYDPDKTFTLKGKRIDTCRTREGKLDNKDNFIVKKREILNVKTKTDEIGFLSKNIHRIYPGALLLGNERIINHNPDIIAVERAPIEYVITSPNLILKEKFPIQPSYADYQMMMNKWLHGYSNDKDLKPSVKTDVCTAFSKEQLKVKFGTEFSNSNIESDIDFSAIHSKEKTVSVLRCKQIFYTVTVQYPKDPADLFGSGVTSQTLSGSINNDNPPVLVESVSYGRVIYLMIETSRTDYDAEYHIERASNFINDFNLAQQSIEKLTDVHMKIYVVGGNFDLPDRLTVASLKEAKEIIIKQGVFDHKNMCLPVHYTCIYVKDNSKILVNSSTDYLRIWNDIYEKGVLELVHDAAYVARWEITWDVMRYDEKGNLLIEKGGWGQNGTHTNASFRSEISLPGNLQRVYICVEYVTNNPFDWWKVLIYTEGYPVIKHRKVTLKGYFWNADYSVEPPRY